MRDVHDKGLLATAEPAEIRDIPVQTDEAQQALHGPVRLPQRHAEQELHRQAGLNGGVGVDGPSRSLARRQRCPCHPGVKPDRQRPAALQRLVVLGPVQGLVGRCVRSAHALQLSRSIHKMNTPTGFVQQSRAERLRRRLRNQYVFMVVD
jgi:hypothetical protein